MYYQQLIFIRFVIIVYVILNLDIRNKLCFAIKFHDICQPYCRQMVNTGPTACIFSEHSCMELSNATVLVGHLETFLPSKYWTLFVCIFLGHVTFFGKSFESQLLQNT